MSQYQARPVVVYVLPLPKKVTALNPEQVIFDFPPKGTLDIGALCYLRRDFDGPRRRRDAGKRVDHSSLDTERVENVRLLIQFIADRFEQTGRSPTTVYGETSLGIVTFLDWADGAGHHRAFYDEPSARTAFRDYVDSLWEKYRLRDIASSTAARQCKYTLDFLSELLGVDDLHRGLNLPTKKSNDAQPTLPPIENTQARAISLCSALFYGLSNLVIDNKTFPHNIEMPKYLGWAQSNIWVFPLHEWFRTPIEIAGDEDKRPHALGYNFSEGRVSLVDEIINFFPTRRHAVVCRRLAASNIRISNQDARHKFRISASMQAHHAFSILFLAYTGMNLTQLLELEWNDEYEVSTIRQKFKVIKWRAHGKIQSFEIQSVFFPDFKRFLALREFILNGRPCRWLFFSLGVGHNALPQQLRYYSPRQMYQRLRRIDPTLPNITPRQWRVADVDWMLRKEVPIAIASDVVQNTEETLKAAYAAGSPEVQKDEMTAFFEKVSSVVLQEAQEIEGSQEGPVGICTGYGRPSAPGGVPKTPDCRNPEGCLFCDNYKVHADEHDTRKLVSCRYCIQKTAPLASSVEHFNEVFGLVLTRIDSLLVEIGQRAKDPDMPNRIIESVEEFGELDGYWAAKLELLMTLDLISP